MVRPQEERAFEQARMVDVEDEERLAYWTQRLDATPEQLRAAVETVGPNAVAVELWLAAPAP